MGHYGRNMVWDPFAHEGIFHDIFYFVHRMLLHQFLINSMRVCQLMLQSLQPTVLQLLQMYLS